MTKKKKSATMVAQEERISTKQLLGVWLILQILALLYVLSIGLATKTPLQ